MVQQRPLGPARAARRVDDVGQAVRAHHRLGVLFRHPLDEVLLSVDADHQLALGRKVIRQRLLRQEQRRTAVLQHEGQSLGRVGRVQRDEGAARLEDAQHPHHQVQRALRAQRHPDLRPHVPPPQVVRELVGPRIQLRVRQRLALEDRGDRVRGALHLRLEELMRGGLRHRGARVVPLDEHPLALGGGEQRQLGDGPEGLGHGALDEHQQVRTEAPDGVLPEQVGAVLDVPGEALGVLGDGERQVEAGRVHLHRHRLEAQPGHHRDARGVVAAHEREHHLEERRPAGVSDRLELLHQLLEGNVLVGVGPQGAFAHAGEELAERGRVVQARAQGQDVGEEADDAFQLGEAAAGDGGADDDVVLAGVAGQQGLEGGQQGHEEGDALLLAEVLERAGERRGNGEVEEGAAERLGRRPGEVGGQIQVRGSAFQVPLPVRELCVQRLVPQPRALPHRVVRVLHRHRGQERGPAGDDGLIERGHLTHQHVAGPAIGDDVVHVEQQHVPLLGEAEDAGAHQRPAPQVERPCAVLVQAPTCLGLAVLVRGQVHHWQVEGRGRRDDLDGGAALVTEVGAQGLMATHQLGEGALHRGHVQHAVHAQGGGHVVDGQAGLELVEEPQALLGEGQRQRRVRPGNRTQRGHRGALGGLVDAQGEPLQGGGLEEGAQGQLDIERRADAGGELGGEQGVATQLEEAVLQARLVDAQQLGPDAGQQLLGGSPRRHVGAQLGARLRGGQGLAVHLGVGRQREGVQAHQGGGHHVLGQSPLQVRAQGGEVEGGVGGEVADETLVAGHVLAGEGHSLAHTGEGEEGGLDFGELDAEAANLHLEVGAAEELEHAVVAPASQVAGAVHARAGRGAEGVGEEALCGEVGAAHIAASQALAADEELPGHASGHRLAVRVEQVHLGGGDGGADGNGGGHLLHGGHPEAGGEEGALGGAVAGGDGNAQLVDDAAHVGRAHDVAAGEQLLHGLEAVQVGLHHLREEAGGEVEGGDGVLLEDGGERVQITR